MILAYLIFPLIGAILGKYKGNAFAGFMYGLLLGPIGCFVIFLLHGDEKECPRCASVINARAFYCLHCMRDVGKVPITPGTLTTWSAVERFAIFILLPLGALILFLYLNRL